jgi:hypothetical protein
MLEFQEKTHLATALAATGATVAVLPARTHDANGGRINQQMLEALETTGASRVRVGEVSLALEASSAVDNESHDE